MEVGWITEATKKKDNSITSQQPSAMGPESEPISIQKFMAGPLNSRPLG
jgi:hypothetical protein